MKIRLAVPDDIPSISNIENTVFSGSVYPAFFFRQAFDLWGSFLLVAENDDIVAGYALGAPAEDTNIAWILSLAVLESARGQGVGKQLVLALLDTMREKRFERVRLTVHPENPAVALYEQTGFTKVAEEAHYFHENDPRIVMELAFA